MGTLIEAVKPNSFWEEWDRKSLLVNIYLTFEPIRTCTIHKQETSSPILRLKASLKANWCWLERWWKNSSQTLRTKLKGLSRFDNTINISGIFRQSRFGSREKMMIFCLQSATQKSNLSTKTFVEELKFACLENWELESKKINHR